jgi:hypothetical protein
MRIYILIVIIFLAFVYYRLRRTSSKGMMSITLWLIISYSFLIITHLFSGILYNSGDLLRIFPYVATCLILIIIGDYAGRKIKTPGGIHLKANPKLFAYLSITGSLLLPFDVLRLNVITFANRIEDFQISAIGVAGNMLISFGLVNWLSALYNYRINRTKISVLSYLSALSFVSGGILTAGRQSILILILCSLIMFIWSSQRRKELQPHVISKTNKRPWGIIIIGMIFLAYFLTISAIRSRIQDKDLKLDMFEQFYTAKVSEETRSVVKHMGPLSDIYIEFLFYYSHELRRLDVLFQNYHYYPIMGLSQMGYLERRLQWLTGKQSEISWKEVEISVEQRGNFSSHTWGTFISNYIIDFGRAGTLIACLLTGLILGILYRRLATEETPQRIIRQCIILAGVIFTIQFSPLVELTWTLSLVITSLAKPVFNLSEGKNAESDNIKVDLIK